MVALAAAEALLSTADPSQVKPAVVFVDGGSKKLPYKTPDVQLLLLVLLGLLGCCKKSGVATPAHAAAAVCLPDGAQCNIASQQYVHGAHLQPCWGAQYIPRLFVELFLPNLCGTYAGHCSVSLLLF